MKLRVSIALVAFLIVGGSTCDDPGTGSGLLQNIVSAALVDCDPYQESDGKEHKCLLLSSELPEQGSMQVFDVTDEQFLMSPVGFPLALQPCSTPSQVVGNPKIGDSAFVLDGIERKVYRIPTRNTENSQSFAFSEERVALAEFANPPRFIDAMEGKEDYWVIGIREDGTGSVATFKKNLPETRPQESTSDDGETEDGEPAAGGPGEGSSEAGETSENDAEPETSGFVTADYSQPTYYPMSWNSGLLSSTTVQDVALIQDTKTLFIGSKEGLSWYHFTGKGKGTSNTNQFAGDISRLAVGKVKINLDGANGEEKNWFLVLGMSQKEKKIHLYFYDYKNTSKAHKTIDVEDAPVVGYIPRVGSANCCGETYDGRWAAMLTASGKLQYIKIQNILDGVMKTVKKQSVSGEEMDVQVGDYLSEPIDVAKVAGVSKGKTAAAVGMFGAKGLDSETGVHVTRILMVFPNFLASINEGDMENIRRIDVK